MSQTPRALTCGLSTLDLLYYVDDVPTENAKVSAKELTVTVGGPSLNAARTATRLGVDTVHMSPIGKASTARIIYSVLENEGVQVIDTQPNLTQPVVSTAIINIHTGTRTVVGINAATTGEQRLTDPQALNNITAALVDGHHMSLASEVASGCRERGIPVLMDGGSWKPDTFDLLVHVDFCIVSAAFTLDGEGSPDLSRIAGYGPRFVARTNGADPIEFFDAERRVSELISVPVVAKVVDTLGAGDVFHGAALAYVATRGLRADTASTALAFAADVASRSVAYRGPHRWADQVDAL